MLEIHAFWFSERPGSFQEMMQILCAKAKQKLQDLGVTSRVIFLSAFFDDSGLGTNSQEEHLMLIEKFIQTRLGNNVRVKLPNCYFMV